MAQDDGGYTKNQALKKYDLFASDLEDLPRKQVFLNHKHFCYVYTVKDLEQCVYRKSNRTKEE